MNIQKKASFPLPQMRHSAMAPCWIGSCSSGVFLSTSGLAFDGILRPWREMGMPCCLLFLTSFLVGGTQVPRGDQKPQHCSQTCFPLSVWLAVMHWCQKRKAGRRFRLSLLWASELVELRHCGRREVKRSTTPYFGQLHSPISLLSKIPPCPTTIHSRFHMLLFSKPISYLNLNITKVVSEP